MAQFTMASISASIAEFRKLSQHVQGRALLKALADRFPRDAFNRVNQLLEPYSTVAPDGFSVGLPEAERCDTAKFQLVSQRRYLIDNGYIVVARSDFYELAQEEVTEAEEDISAIKQACTVVGALRFLHSELQSFEHGTVCA